MMNHQGGMGQLNCNANNQNEVNPQSIGALGFLPSASSLTGGDQRFSNRVSGPNHLLYKEKESVNIVPNNDHSAGVFPYESSEALGLSSSSSLTGNVRRLPDSLSGSNVLHYQESNNIIPNNGHTAGIVPRNIDLNAEFAGNNHYNSLNMSVGLCLHPIGPENQNTSNSSTTVIDSGVSGYIVEEQGLDSSSVDMRRLSCKRRSPEHADRELLIGESSTMAAQAGISKRRASEVNANNSLNISAPCTGPVSHQEQFETRTSHGTIRLVSDMQHLSETRQSESFQSNIHLRTVDQQAFPPSSMLSLGYMRDSRVQLPRRPPLFYQYNHPSFFRSSETPVSAISLVQPFEHVPNFHETSQARPQINIMSASTVSPSFLPVYSAMGRGLVVPFHYLRNIAGNTMLDPQIGRENWAHNAGNSSFVNGTANFRGVAYPSHNSSVSGIHPSNASTWVPRFNFAEHYVQTPSGIVNHPVVASTGFPRQSSHSQSDSDSSAVSQEIDFSVGFGNTISQNQPTSEARSENQAVHSPDIWSPANDQFRISLMIELRNALHHLRSGGSLRRQDFMMLDHSIILHLLEEYSDRDEVNLDAELMAYEDLVALEEHIGNVNMGLSVETILSHLRQEKFWSISEGSTANESCCICQEDYLENEDLGKLDCGHRFHVDCIKPWLLRKNTCPICKQIALTITEHDP